VDAKFLTDYKRVCPESDMVAQTCNPSFLGGGDREDHSLSSGLGEKLRPYLNQWLGAMACPSYTKKA
jgi:hypothetical protein